MATTATRSSTTTFAEYLLLPYDGSKTELVNGTIVEMADPTALHEDIIAFLLDALRAYIQAQEHSLIARAGVSIEIPRDRTSNARRPDVIVCSRSQWTDLRKLTQAVFLAGNPPALAIEVVSPNNLSRDTVDKRQDYALAGVPEYWIVNPIDGYVLVLVLNGSEYQELGEYRDADRIESRLLPQLELLAETILEPPVL
ncbi:MAG: Uma2 family endonuclease [Cyanobacteria bacterium J06628_6]